MSLTIKPTLPKHRKIGNIHEAAYQPFAHPDGEMLGNAILQLDDTKELGVGFHTYLMPPA